MTVSLYFLTNVPLCVGRDSVICLYGEDIFPGSRKQSVSGTVMDPRDRELIDRLKHQLMSSRDHNLADIRSICEERDTLRHGILPVRVVSTTVYTAFTLLNTPLFNKRTYVLPTKQVAFHSKLCLGLS